VWTSWLLPEVVLQCMLDRSWITKGGKCYYPFRAQRSVGRSQVVPFLHAAVAEIVAMADTVTVSFCDFSAMAFTL
jgi:hypothetical protein